MSVRLRPDRSVLAAVPLFVGLEAPARDDVMALAQVRRVARGATVFEQGGAANAVHVLLQGHVKAIQTNSSGQQMVVHFVNPRELFCCTALMGAAHYPTTALAIKESIVLSWSAADMLHLMKRHPEIAIKALAGLGNRMTDMRSRLGGLHTERVSRRIANALLHLVRHSGRQLEIGIKIDFPVSRQDLAEIAGTTLHTVSRTLSKWQKLGILKSGRQSIVVVNPHRLVTLAQERE